MKDYRPLNHSRHLPLVSGSVTWSIVQFVSASKCPSGHVKKAAASVLRQCLYSTVVDVYRQCLRLTVQVAGVSIMSNLFSVLSKDPLTYEPEELYMKKLFIKGHCSLSKAHISSFCSSCSWSCCCCSSLSIISTIVNKWHFEQQFLHTAAFNSYFICNKPL